jgi:23S rRNA (cytidine2498-2'-O)-methyltransferase
MNALFLYCRAGFENDCASEITDKAAQHGISGYCKAKPQSGYVVFTAIEPARVDNLHHQLPLAELIFCRQWFVILDMRNDLPVDDRVTPLVELLQKAPAMSSQVMVDTPDTNEGKQLSPLCRKLTPLLEKPLRPRDITEIRNENPIILHVCFLSTHAAYVGYALANNSEPWPMGVPRLKFPSQAPSRSTLKLEEAILRLLTVSEREQLLKPGMHAVDLGAAPGGWTYQLLKRQLKVTAVDNGNLQAELFDSGLLEHMRADGFSYEPPQPVNWMVCDIIDRPQRVIERATLWLTSGWCRQTIFNLKLPMKQRYLHTTACLTYLQEQLQEHNLSYRMACKQLYHDREEVTVFARLLT